MDTAEDSQSKSLITLLKLISSALIVGLGISFILFVGWKSIIPTLLILVSCLLIIYRKTKSGITTFIITIIGLCLFPALQAARPASHRIECRNNLTQIALAIHEYHDEYDVFPPPYTISEDGTPLQSWRVLILPYLGENELYKQINLSQPWNSQQNALLEAKMPDCYGCPSALYNSKWYSKGTTTAYVVGVGEDTVWPDAAGRKMTDVTDGTSNSILIIESEPHRIPWMSPDDPEVDKLLEQLSFGNPHAQCLLAVFADGGVRILPSTLKKNTVQKLLTINDGEVISGL